MSSIDEPSPWEAVGHGKAMRKLTGPWPQSRHAELGQNRDRVFGSHQIFLGGKRDRRKSKAHPARKAPTLQLNRKTSSIIQFNKFRPLLILGIKVNFVDADLVSTCDHKNR